MIRRTLVLAAATFMVLGMLAGPASAHHLQVTPRGAGSGPDAGPFEPGGWVGGGPVPASERTQGLAPGPEGTLLPRSHATGLNTACEALRGHGNSVVDIYGPPPQAFLPPDVESGCAHGEVITPPE